MGKQVQKWKVPQTGQRKTWKVSSLKSRGQKNVHKRITEKKKKGESTGLRVRLLNKSSCMLQHWIKE